MYKGGECLAVIPIRHQSPLKPQRITQSPEPVRFINSAVSNLCVHMSLVGLCSPYELDYIVMSILATMTRIGHPIFNITLSNSPTANIELLAEVAVAVSGLTNSTMAAKDIAASQVLAPISTCKVSRFYFQNQTSVLN